MIKIRHILFLSLLMLSSYRMWAQQTFPTNGPANDVLQYFAIVNVHIQSTPETLIKNAKIIVKDGVIEAIGANLNIPKEAKIIDGKGQYLYPSFIDLFSSYGLSAAKPTEGSEQYANNTKGAYAWNDAVKSYQEAASEFKVDTKANKNLMASGFGAALVAIPDGIFRGSAALVLSGNQHEQKMLVQPEAATQMSFNKGSSKQAYPGSMMGCIALIRQTFYDADWYSKNKVEYNIGLEKINATKKLPVIFEAENKLAILRAAKIAKEFSSSFIIKGNGDEYQRINEIKASGARLIIPLNFPKPYEIASPLDALKINLGDLKHWELAPANAAWLNQNQVPFSITMESCKDAETFLKNLRKAVVYGLNERAALAALTTTPAQWLGINNMGSIEKGKMANFFICTGNLFENGSEISSHFIKGEEHVIKPQVRINISGNYSSLDAPFATYTLSISEKDGKYSGLLKGKDTIKVSIQELEGIYSFSFPETAKSKNIIRLNAWVQNINPLDNKAKIIVGNWGPNAQNTASFKLVLDSANSEQAKKQAEKKPELGNIIYPFCEYGNEKQPTQENIIFRGATVWTNELDSILYETDVAISGGKIVSIGKNLSLPNAKIIDAKGKFLTNGIIDEHSHIAIYRGVNECTQNNTSEVRIGDVINSEDINIYRQLSGGVIACQQLHGSCNPIGGQSSIIKLRWGKSPEEMKISGADGFIKFALGENVKQSNWGAETGRFPQTRMGVEQVYYDAFIRAREYEAALKANPKLTRKDLEMEAVLEILNKKRFISCHSYVQSEINMLMHVADSMGFVVNTFTHILEGYKVADKMKKHGASASTFADWWAYKYEVIDAIPQNAGILNNMGVVTAINSDDAEMGRRLNQEAAKIIKYTGISEMDAWKMVTLNPAKMLHLSMKTGSIKVGKDADLVLWSHNPLSIEAKALYTLVDGIIYYDRSKDAENRKQIEAERNRIIQKMMEAKQNGEKTESKVSELDPDYHCED